MNAPAAKRARPPALDAVVSTVAAPGLGKPNGLFVLADSTLLACSGHSIRVLAPSGLLPALLLAGNNTSSGNQDGPGADARFDCPVGITVDPAGNVVVVDSDNHALRLVSKAGAVSTLAGGGGKGFADGQGAAAARFKDPFSVVVTANGDYVMTDFSNHAVRVVTPGGAVRTLAGNGNRGFVDGQGAAARFNEPVGLAVDVDGSILVTDRGNHAVRRVTMPGAVSTVAGNGHQGYADGEGAAARFNRPTAVVVDKEGTIVVADTCNNRLCRMTGRHVTTLAGSSEAGTADGAGAGARFTEPWRLALDERGRLLVMEGSREDMLRVVEASLAPPPWMGPVNAAARAHAPEEKDPAIAKLQEDYGKLVEAPELADVVLVVEGERFPAHRNVLAVRSEYFRGLLLSGMQEGRSSWGRLARGRSGWCCGTCTRLRCRRGGRRRAQETMRAGVEGRADALGMAARAARERDRARVRSAAGRVRAARRAWAGRASGRRAATGWCGRC
jgi:DNA-binding beta-propeller fold protein YncE